MGFGCVLLGTYKDRYVACKVEDALQAKYHHYPLGRRLWRAIAKGRKTPEVNTPVRVFLTYHMDLRALLGGGRIHVVR